MYTLETFSLITIFQVSSEETKAEKMGSFMGLRLNAREGWPLDGQPFNPQRMAAASARLGRPVTPPPASESSAASEAAAAACAQGGRGDGAVFYSDMAWWLSDVIGRLDVVLAPQVLQGDWYPYWEVESGRKMAAQFRSSGVGYLRLADDMGRFGKCFLSVDAGRTYLADTAFEGADGKLAHGSSGGSSSGGGATPSVTRCNSIVAGMVHTTGDDDGSSSAIGSGSSSSSPSIQGKQAAAAAARNEAMVRVAALKAGADSTDSGAVPWKVKAELLRNAADALSALAAAQASLLGGALPLCRSGNNNNNGSGSEGARAANSLSSTAGGNGMGGDTALAALGCVQDVLTERGKNVHVVAAALALLQVSACECASALFDCYA